MMTLSWSHPILIYMFVNFLLDLSVLISNNEHFTWFFLSPSAITFSCYSFKLPVWLQICFPLYCKDKIALKTGKRGGSNPQGLQAGTFTQNAFTVSSSPSALGVRLWHSWEKATSLGKFLAVTGGFVYFSSVCLQGLFLKTNISLFFLIMNVWENAFDRYSRVQKLKLINNWNVVEYEVMNTNYSFHVWQLPVDQYISPDFNLVLVMVSSIAH